MLSITNRLYHEVATVTSIKIEDNTTAGKYLILDSDSNTTVLTGDRTLTIDVNNTSPTLDMAANLTVEATSIINQDLSTDATATLSTLSLSATSNQIVLQSAGITGTITATPTTPNKVWTLQNITGTIYQSSGEDVAVADGGTNMSSYAVGDIVHATGTGVLAGLADVAVGSVLISGGVNTVASWSTDIATGVTIGGQYVYRVGGTDVAVTDGGTGVGVSTGTVAVVLSTSPTLVTPEIGAATGVSLGLTGAVSTNTGLATGEIGIDLYSITPTFSTIAQSDAEGIASSSDLRIGLDETLRTMIICDRGDIATDLGLSAATHPTLRILSNDAASKLTLIYNIIETTGTMNIRSAGKHMYTSRGDISSGNMFTLNSDANIELTDANAEQSWMYLEPKINQTSTASYTGLLMNITETGLGDGSTNPNGTYNSLIDLRVGAATVFNIQSTAITNASTIMQLHPKGTSEVSEIELHDADGERLSLYTTADRAYIKSSNALGIQVDQVQDVNFWESIASGNPSINIYGWNTAGSNLESTELTMDDTNDEFLIQAANSANHEGVTVSLQEANQRFRTRGGLGIQIVAGALNFPEITTPTPIGSFGALYTKTDDILYFQDGAGTEHAIIGADEDYAEMYLNANGTATTIETASIPIALRQFTTGSLQNFTFDAGSTAAITAYADYDGTVGGTVLATSTHGLTTLDIISIRGTTNYNGIFQITVVDSTHFYFTDTWAGDDGASDFDQPSHLIAGSTAAGEYIVSWDMSSAAGSGGDTFIFCVYNNTTAHLSSKVQRKFANNDVGAYGGCGVITVAAGDWIFLTALNDGTGTITNSYGAMILTRL